MIQIKLLKECNFKGYTLIEGFPGAGLVGPMAASYMIEKLKMEYCGYIESDLFPPIAAIHDGVPLFPARIYMSQKSKLVIVMSEFIIPPNAIYPLSSELLSFVRKNGISKIVSVGGIPSKEPTSAQHITSPDKELIKKAASKNIKAIDEGVIAGVSAVIMTGAEQLKIPVLSILVEINPQITDPKYAEVAIGALNKIINTNIDLEELDKEAKEVEAKIKELMSKVKESHDRYEKAATDSNGPSMFA